jgi:HEAT repeats
MTNQQGVSIPDVLANLAGGSADNFNLHFTRLRKMFPEEVAEACLGFIASRELTPAARSMALWVSSQDRYVHVLFESDALPVEVACCALAALRTVDDSFLSKFRKATDQISSSPSILRALNLVPSLGDYSVLVPWLRKLSEHDDDRVKSRAVKLLCELRPNKPLIERQMQSDSPRVRANAIEALWRSRTPEAKYLFNMAIYDPNHRVVGNALVGLHLQDDPAALSKMIELSSSPDPLVRSAMAWCFAYVQDPRVVPVLGVLSKDPSVIVRKRALRSLFALQPASEADDI